MAETKKERKSYTKNSKRIYPSRIGNEVALMILAEMRGRESLAVFEEYLPTIKMLVQDNVKAWFSGYGVRYIDIEEAR